MPMNIKQAAYSLLTYPSIELSLYSSSKGSLQLHQLATIILESLFVHSSDNYTIDIILHPVDIAGTSSRLILKMNIFATMQ